MVKGLGEVVLVTSGVDEGFGVEPEIPLLFCLTLIQASAWCSPTADGPSPRGREPLGGRAPPGRCIHVRGCHVTASQPSGLVASASMDSTNLGVKLFLFLFVYYYYLKSLSRV